MYKTDDNHAMVILGSTTRIQILNACCRCFGITEPRASNLTGYLSLSPTKNSVNASKLRLQLASAFEHVRRMRGPA